MLDMFKTLKCFRTKIWIFEVVVRVEVLHRDFLQTPGTITCDLP